MSTRSPVKFNLSNWDGFSDLPKDGIDYLLDTTEINKRLKDKQDSPYRMRVGSFYLPKGIQGEMKDRACEKAIKQFLLNFRKQGFDLASKVQVYGPFPAYDILYQVIRLDQEEWRCRAVFKTNPKPMRIELPLGSVRKSKDQKGTLQEVMKSEGITAVPISKRPKK